MKSTLEIIYDSYDSKKRNAWSTNRHMCHNIYIIALKKRLQVNVFVYLMQNT